MVHPSEAGGGPDPGLWASALRQLGVFAPRKEAAEPHAPSRSLGVIFKWPWTFSWTCRWDTHHFEVVPHEHSLPKDHQNMSLDPEIKSPKDGSTKGRESVNDFLWLSSTRTHTSTLVPGSLAPICSRLGLLAGPWLAWRGSLGEVLFNIRDALRDGAFSGETAI